MRFRSAHVIGAAAIAAALTAGVYRSAVLAKTAGADFEVICAAGGLMADMRNPYAVPPISAGDGMSATPMTYPPLVAVAVRPVCGAVAPVPLILAGVAVLLVLTIALTGVGVAPAAWAILSGAAAFPWLVLTGNVMALVEGFCGLFAAAAIARNRPAVFGAAVGAAAFAKLMPAAYLIAAFVRWPARAALAAAVTALAVFGALQLLSFATTPAALAHYWTAVGTGWDGFVEAELRFGSENNPSMFSFLPIAAAHAGIGAAAGYALAAVVALGFAVAWLRLWRRHATPDAARVWLALLAMSVVAVVYPRFKPYTMVFLLPALAMIFARLRGTALNVALVVACLLPNVALIGMTWLAAGPPMPVPVVFALQYAQWVLIACALALALRPAVMRQLAGSNSG